MFTRISPLEILAAFAIAFVSGALLLLSVISYVRCALTPRRRRHRQAWSAVAS